MYVYVYIYIYIYMCMYIYIYICVCVCFSLMSYLIHLHHPKNPTVSRPSGAPYFFAVTGPTGRGSTHEPKWPFVMGSFTDL